MRDGSHTMDAVQAGTKRKRVFSSNENAHTGGRPARGSGRLKRQRSTGRRTYSSDDDQMSVMDVDGAPPPWQDSDASDNENDEAVDSC
jgi:mitogen-activated protein kinase kinase kinase 13